MGPLLWKWYVTQSCAEKRAVYQFLFRFGTAVAEKNYWLSVATTKKYSSACFHQMTRKLFPALLTRLSRYWYYFKPYTLTSVGIFSMLIFYTIPKVLTPNCSQNHVITYTNLIKWMSFHYKLLALLTLFTKVSDWIKGLANFKMA